MNFPTISQKLTPTEILEINQHRPWQLPTKRWVMYQEWHNAVFAHWKVEPDIIRQFIPNTLEIDLDQNGESWVSIIAFKIKNIRPRYLPAFAPISNFDEINIRTYVRYNDKAGIYFFKLEANNKISCHLARMYSQLPYRYSKITPKSSTYSSYNENRGDSLYIDFDIHARQKAPGRLDRWLTERYIFFQDNNKGLINELEIHHYPWPLFHATANSCIVEYEQYNTFFRKQPSIVHYSPGVQVLTWDKIQHIPGKQS
jgi:uncharacterized protein